MRPSLLHVKGMVSLTILMLPCHLWKRTLSLSRPCVLHPCRNPTVSQGRLVAHRVCTVRAAFAALQDCRGLRSVRGFVCYKKTTDVAEIDLQRLRTKTKRRARMDLLHLRACILETYRIAGSSATVAHCHSGNPKVDQLITDAMRGRLFKIQIKPG